MRYAGWLGYRGTWSLATYGPTEWDVIRNLVLTPHPHWYSLLVLPAGVHPCRPPA